LSRRALVPAVVLLLLIAPRAGWAWGARMHEIVNRRAADLVPAPAGDAWRPLAPRLGNHASDADSRKGFDADEPRRHYIDLDVWGDWPFDDVPRSFEKLARREGRENVLRFGTVPWAIEESYHLLVLSLREGDWSSAGAWAADLGHYVADAHQPLHGSVHYDGQKTGNDGIHLRFEVAMMDRFFDEARLDLGEGPRDPGGDVLEACFGWIAEAHPYVAEILEGDDRARAADPDFGDRYYEVLWDETGELASLQMGRAVRDLAGLYAAAWREAGAPPPPDEVPPFLARSAETLRPPAPQAGPASRRAFLVAGAAILGAFVAGSL